MTDTQPIKDRIDVVQLIQEYVPLKKAGANWKARCPFHNEKSPSFMVHADKQIWHCFGCGKGGDIFSFIQEMEGMSFPEALKLLANRAGVKIDTFRSDIDTSQRNRLLAIVEAAAIFFHRFLLELPSSVKALEYLTAERGLTPAAIKNWQIGYSPDQWDLLTKYLLKKGFNIDDMVMSGLVIRRDGADPKTGRGFYDRFRSRIMFPLHDVHGTVVGFTGRLLKENSEQGGKYVNTPQTIIYDKSRLLYGLDKAKADIKSAGYAVLVEGQMDVISSHEAGIKPVVAASGTALTPEQLRLLKRYTNALVIAFDSDSAGESAGKRGIDTAVAEGFTVRIATILAGHGKDADECVRANPEVWKTTIANAQEVMEWYFVLTEKKLLGAKPADIQVAGSWLLEKIRLVPFALVQDAWLRRLAELIHTDTAVLREAMKQPPQRPSREAAMSHGLPATPPPSSVISNATRLDQLLEAWIALLLRFPVVLKQEWPKAKEEYFTHSRLAPLYPILAAWYTSSGFSGETPADETVAQILVELELKADQLFADLTEQTAPSEAERIGQAVAQTFRHDRRKILISQLAQAERTGENDQVQKLVHELHQL